MLSSVTGLEVGRSEFDAGWGETIHRRPVPCLGGCATKDGSMTVEVSISVFKARVAYVSRKHLYYYTDVSLKSLVSCASVR